MQVLIVHQNFPGQFRRLAETWSKLPGWTVTGLGRSGAPGLQSVQWYGYQLSRAVSDHQHPYLRQMEGAVLHGQAVARALMQLRRRGYTPDVVLAHPGWGETMFLRDVYPDTRLLHFCEWYYGTHGSDVGFDPEFPASLDTLCRLRTWNALHALNLAQCDVGISPTEWQRSRHPAEFQHKIHLIHEGIDTSRLQPAPNAQLSLPDGAVLNAGEPVVTYVARNLEPYRGFHVFMRALELIQKKHPTCQAVVVGGDEVSYGQKPVNAANWREKMLSEVVIDPKRVHFLGKVPYDTYLKVLQVSAAHVYLTYPFVLSWSMLEAMACGCLVVGSDTPPVREVIKDGFNGLLCDFFDHARMADTVVNALNNQRTMQAIRLAARQHVVERYDCNAGEQAFRSLLSI